MENTRDADRRRTQIADAFRTKLWPVPTIGVVIAIAAGLILSEVDDALQKRSPATIADFLFGGGPAEARELLGTIASSLVTVTSLTFSLTVVTLQLASGQYSPRLLRTFARDRFVQFTLALFLSTFVYALTILRTIRDATSTNAMFVPKFSVTLAYVLTLGCVIGLVFFLAHLVREIRVETMMHTVYDDAAAAAKTVFGELDQAGNASSIPRPPPWALPICATSSGFLVSVNEASLLSAAVDADAAVSVDRLAGDWLVAGTPIAFAWRLDATEELDGQPLRTLRDRVATAVHTGEERTPIEDVRYGLRQLTDVAVKALSPGINDPTTAVHALGFSTSLLGGLAGRRLGPKLLRDDDGIARVVLNRPSFADLLDLAVSQVRAYGANDATVLSQLFILLRELAWCAAPTAGHESAIVDQLARLRHTVSGQGFDEREREGMNRLGSEVERALAASRQGGQSA